MQIRPLPRGSLASLASQPLDASAAKMKPSDVLVAVKAVGINFRDVLNVLGMYPGDPGAPGSDCAGVIMRTGSAVAAFQPGDAVFGLAHGCLGTAVVSPAAMLAPMPSMLSFQEAATTPTVFITGGYCLQGGQEGL
jgi:NADPH:quinone reductase-like Zn-dependent oxidoreductase